MDRSRRIRFLIKGVLLLALLPSGGRADTVTVVTNPSAQAADDSIDWSQLGADATALGASFGLLSAKSNSISVSLKGPSSLTAVVCPASPCSWVSGFTSGDTLLWTADDANGGNGPLALAFGNPVFGAGATVKADSPGAFTLKLQAFHNGKPLKTFTAKSDAAGDPLYLGILDDTGANITSVTFSLSACPKFSSCADFAIGKIAVNATHP